jgi:hypothetical protein
VAPKSEFASIDAMYKVLLNVIIRSFNKPAAQLGGRALAGGGKCSDLELIMPADRHVHMGYD